MTDEHNGQENITTTKSKHKFPWEPVGWAVGIFVLVIVTWLNFPIVDQMVRGRYTPTPMPPTLTYTPLPTRTPPPPATVTPPPPPPDTPHPPSASRVEDLAQLDPPVPGFAGPGYILDEETSAAVNPDFSNPQWLSSATIAQQLSKEITEAYRATFGSGAITWYTDIALDPGMYQIFVMDTVFSSAGPLEFHVSLGSNEIFPIYGTRSVDFLSSRSDVAQVYDQWRSIGIYTIDRPDRVSVSTAWEERDEYSIVAVDRVAIAPLSTSEQSLISVLPKDRPVFFVDDMSADIQSRQVLYNEETTLSWGDDYQYAVNPEGEITITWKLPEPAPIGQYEVVVFIPALHSSLPVTYKVMINGADVPNDQTGSTVTLDPVQSGVGRWVSLGTWTTPRIYEKPVTLALVGTLPGGDTGDVSFDVIAFMKVP